MVQSIHAWLIANPITRDVIIGMVVGLLILFLTPALSPAIETFWRFWSIPPQKLNIWLLKARLSSAQARRKRLQRQRYDLRYFVLSCVRCTFYMQFTLLFICVAIWTYMTRNAPHLFFWPLPSPSTLGIYVATSLFSAVAYVTLFLALRRFNELTAATDNPKGEESELSRTVARLKEKLRLKGIASDSPTLVETEESAGSGHQTQAP